MDAEDIAENLQEETVTDEGKTESGQPEKMLPASRVTQLIKKAKFEGEQKMQAQLDEARQQLEQLQSQQAQAQSQSQQQPQGSQGQGLTPEQMQAVMQAIEQKRAQDAAEQERAQIDREAKDAAKMYFDKLAQGSEAYEDFDEITASFDPAAFPQLVYLATQADNTADIIYELQKNPAKLATLSHLVDKSPAMAKAEIAKLSNSIKTNVDAKRNLQETQDPLSRLKPTTVGTDTGNKSVRDFKNAPWLRV